MVGRKKELKFFESQYSSEDNSLVVLYGRQGTGKTTLVTEFLKDKSGLYYLARDCSEREQLLRMKEEWQNNEGLPAEGDSFYDIISSAIELKSDEKTVIVIDEVHNAFRQGSALVEALTRLCDTIKYKNNCMIILISSSVQWVENRMVSETGALARYITGFRKLNNFGFLEIVNRFSELDSKNCVYIYGILGGVPGYVDMWNPKENVRDNVIRLFLDKNALFYKEPERFLKSELRELALYNTILANLADGRQKLNSLYSRTGFSRAKISVYIKNLIQLDIVEKIFSMERGAYDNIQKGLYGIKDSFIHFWYRFVFPNMGLIEQGRGEYVYDTVIAPALDEYMHRYFVKVCKEYLDLMNVYKKLPVRYELCESWFGKDKSIDIVTVDVQDGRILAGTCKWADETFGEEDFAKLLESMEYAGISADYYYLFSENGFIEEFESGCGQIDNIWTIDLNSL